MPTPSQKCLSTALRVLGMGAEWGHAKQAVMTAPRQSACWDLRLWSASAQHKRAHRPSGVAVTSLPFSDAIIGRSALQKNQRIKKERKKKTYEHSNDECIDDHVDGDT